MIFHEYRLLADDSHVISYLIFVENWEMYQNLSSAAVVIGALRVKDNNMITSIFRCFVQSALVNRKFHISLISHPYEELVQARHI